MMPDEEDVMGKERVTVSLDNFEQRLMVIGLVGFRNGLITKEQPTEDVDMLILKVIDAKPEKKRRRSWDRDAR